MDKRFSEAIKVEDGRFCNLPFHIARMQRTAQSFFGTAPDIANIEIPQEYRHGVVKCRIVYDREIRGVFFDHYTIKPRERVQLVDGGDIDYRYKYENRSELNRLLEKCGRCDDVLIVKNGLVADLSSANIVFKDARGGLFTPSKPLLPGTKRAYLLLEGVINERDITPADIPSYEGFYVINAMIDIADDVFVRSENVVPLEK